jgi:TonB family protein
MARRTLSIPALVALLATLASASMPVRAARAAPGHNLDQSENQVWISALRQSQFSIVPHVAAHAGCEVSEPPEALATPDPLVERPGSGKGITVSFIVGTDGRVHSLFILEGDNPFDEGTVLKAVRSWRYRPAKCNGVPIDAEARIQFRVR